MPIQNRFKKGNPLLDAVSSSWLNSVEKRLSALEGLNVTPPLFISMSNGSKLITNPIRNTKVRLGQLEGQLAACGVGSGTGTANLITRDSSFSSICDQFVEDTNTPIDIINHSSTAIDDNTVGLIVEHINADIKTNLFFPVSSPFLKVGKLPSGTIAALSGSTPGTGTIDIWEFTNGSVAVSSPLEQVTGYNFNDKVINTGDFVLIHKEKVSDRWIIIKLIDESGGSFTFNITADDGAVTLAVTTGETIDFEGTGNTTFNPRAQSEWGILTKATAGSPEQITHAVDPSVLQHFTATADTVANSPLIDVATPVTTAQMDIKDADVSGIGNWFEIVSDSSSGLHLTVDSTKAKFEYSIRNPFLRFFADTNFLNINHHQDVFFQDGACISTFADVATAKIQINLDDIFKIGKANGSIAAISGDTPGRLASPGNEVSVWEFSNGVLADTAVDINAYNVTDQIIANGEYVHLALETDSKRWLIIRTLDVGGDFNFDISGDIDGTAFTIASGDEIAFIGADGPHNWDNISRFIEVTTIEDASAGLHTVAISTAKIIRVGKAGGGIAAISGSDPGTGTVTIYDDDGTGTWTATAETETGYNFSSTAISASDWLYLEMSMDDENKWLVHPLNTTYTWVVDADSGGPKTIANAEKLFIKGTTDEIIVTLSGVSPTFSAVIKVGDAILKQIAYAKVGEGEISGTSPILIKDGTPNSISFHAGDGTKIKETGADSLEWESIQYYAKVSANSNDATTVAGNIIPNLGGATGTAITIQIRVPANKGTNLRVNDEIIVHHMEDGTWATSAGADFKKLTIIAWTGAIDGTAKTAFPGWVIADGTANSVVNGGNGVDYRDMFLRAPASGLTAITDNTIQGDGINHDHGGITGSTAQNTTISPHPDHSHLSTSTEVVIGSPGSTPGNDCVKGSVAWNGTVCGAGLGTWDHTVTNPSHTHNITTDGHLPPYKFVYWIQRVN